jgi:hypothetical protein
VTILSLIGSGGSEHLVQRALEMIFTERIRAQDAPSIWVSCSANPLGRDLTWRFTQVRAELTFWSMRLDHGFFMR